MRNFNVKSGMVSLASAFVASYLKDKVAKETNHEKNLSCLNNSDTGCHMVDGSYIRLCRHR